MRKAFLSLLTFLMCLTVIFALASCGKDVEFKVNFVVDGEIYSTINTSGEEIIKIPENPTKEGYTFDGWYWDKDEWQRPFTANSLLDAPLSSDMNVYAKWAHIHISSDWIVDKAATCKEAGAKHKECTDCEEVLETASIDKLTTHTPSEAVTENFVDSDCETEGSYNLVVYCSVCGEKLSSEAKVVEKKPHTPSDWKIDKNATCKEIGAKHKECTECAEVIETQTIDKLTTHTPGEAVVENFVDSTCKATGSYNTVVYCSVCEEKLSSESKTVEKKPHTEVTDKAVEPTCTKTGLTEGKHCLECDTVIVEQTVVKMLDHEYSDELSFGATHHFYECECGHKKDETRHTSSGAATATTDEVCTVCGYVITKAVGISFKTLTVNGTNIYSKVSNDTTYYSFINEIVAVGGAKYVVSTNISGNNVIPNKTIDLNIGDNTVYITEYINDEPTVVYTVVIKRRAICEVQFSANGGTSVLTQYVEEDSFATEPQTSRAGYTFAGWNYDFAKPITKNEVISASWNPNENTKFEVWYYLQNIDGSYPSTPNVVDKITGTTDTIATAEQKNFPHFTFDEVKSIMSGNIDGDGSLVLTVYYTRDTYTISTSVSDTKGGSVTSGGTYPYGSEITLSVIVNAGYTFDGYKIGDNIVWNTPNYSFTVNEDAVFVVDVTANTNTKYIVEYYLSNIESGYTMVESVELYGTTDTTAIANQKTFDHFTFDSNKSIMRGNIDGNGSLVLEVYYTRDSYTVTTSVNNSLAGAVTSGDTYKFDTKMTLTAKTNPGYTFLGWYEGDTRVCETLSYTFNIDHNATYEVKWKANENTKYEVWHYLENIDGSYSAEPNYVDRLEGTTDTEITVHENLYNHFTYDANNSVVSGNINGDGSLVIKLYYTRNTYTITSADTSLGTISVGGNHAYNKQITVSVTAVKLGYSFVGWYSGEKLLSTFSEYTFNIENDVVAKFDIAEEMQNFNFTSTAKTCIVSGIKDRSVTEIVIPDCVTSISDYAFRGCTKITYITVPSSVTSIGAGAFSECTALKGITIPFVGSMQKDDIDTYQYPFGYIFGTESYDGGIATTQYYYGSSTGVTTSTTYYIPASLKSVTVTSGKLLTGAFYNCKNLKSVTLGSGVTTIGHSAFEDCSALTSITIPDSVTWIGDFAFGDCTSLVSVTLGVSVKDIKSTAFYGCYKLIEVINHSSLNISAGSWNYGEVAIYAIEVHSGESKVVTYEDYLFYTYGGVNYLISYTGTSTVITLPENYNKEYYEIYRYAFYSSGNLTSVTIPDGVISIGSKAFLDCTSLTTIIIPATVTSIGNSAFKNCTGLTAVYYKGTLDNLVEIYNASSDDALYNLTCYYSEKEPTDSGSYWHYDENDNVIIWDIREYYTEGLEFALNSDKTSYSVVNYTGANESVLIPATYNGLPVTSIEQSAFSGCSIESAALPASLIEGIPKENLKIVVITSGESISTRAFEGCTRLTSITIPESVTSIGSKAFSGCTSLEAVYITNIENWCKIDFGNSYANPLCYAENLYLNGNLITELVIPGNITAIKPYAFCGFSSLTSVTITSSVVSIGDDAFSDCLRLVEVINKSTLNIISGSYNYGGVGYYAKVVHNGESRIVNKNGYLFITPNDGINYLFGYIGSDVELVLPDDYNAEDYVINDFAFLHCTDLKSVTIPYGVTSIGESAFSGCTNITSVIISNSVTSIGSYAFNACTNLTNITIPDSVTTVGYAAFSNCGNLEIVTIGKGVKSIGAYAFCNCASLTGVTIPDSVTSIGYYVFYNCDGLTSVTIPNSVTSIGYSAFSGCNNLENVTIPNSVKSIDDYTFSDCTRLTSVTIPYSITSIGRYAFKNCTSLTSMTISNSVTSIGDYAFSGCTSLASATIPDSVISIGHCAFQNCYSLTRVSIGGSVTSIGDAAFDNCTGITKVTIPYSVTSIGYNAFANCTNLISVIFDNPNGWTVDGRSITGIASAPDAAYYLTKTYREYYWKRI